MKLTRLKEQQVADDWPRLKAILQPAFERSKTDPANVLKQGRNGFKQLWEASEGAQGLIVTSCGEDTFWIEYVAGTWGRIANVSTLINYFENVAKKHGYKRIKIYGRQGWKRLLRDYRAKPREIGQFELEKVL